MSCVNLNIPASTKYDLQSKGILIITPEDSLYEAACHQRASYMGTYMQQFRNLCPSILFYCKTDRHVIEVIRLATHSRMQVVVRGGGTDPVGLSSSPGAWMIDISKRCFFEMDTLSTVYAPKIRVGAGLSSRTLLQHLTFHHCFVPMNVDGSICIGGHFSNGGFGFISRLEGIGADCVHSFRIALSNGSIVHASKKKNASLYWAVLGSSPGSWGVILDYTLTPYPYIPSVQIASFYWKYNPALFLKLIHILTCMFIKDELNPHVTMKLEIGTTETGRRIQDYTHYIKLHLVGKENWECFDSFVQSITDISPPLSNPFPCMTRSCTMPISEALQHTASPFQYRPLRYHVINRCFASWPGKGYWERIVHQIDQRILSSKCICTLFRILSAGGRSTETRSHISYPSSGVLHIHDWVFGVNESMPSLGIQLGAFHKSCMEIAPIPCKMAVGWVDTMDETSELEQDWETYMPSRSWYERLQRIKKTVDSKNMFCTRRTIPLPLTVCTIPCCIL